MFLNTALAEVAQLILQRPPHLCETFGNLFPAILHLQGNLKTRTSPAGAPVSHKQPAAHRAAPSARASPPLPPPPPPSSARSRFGQSPSSCSTSRTGRPPATAQDSLAVDNQPSVGVISREYLEKWVGLGALKQNKIVIRAGTKGSRKLDCVLSIKAAGCKM